LFFGLQIWLLLKTIFFNPAFAIRSKLGKTVQKIPALGMFSDQKTFFFAGSATYRSF
jgi:hypothetical protein